MNADLNANALAEGSDAGKHKGATMLTHGIRPSTATNIEEE